MQKKIFKSIFITSLSISFVAMLLFLYTNSQFIFKDTQERLIKFTHTLAQSFNERGDDIDFSLLHTFSYRLSLLDPDGKVIFDSAADNLDNHNDRNEFIVAKEKGVALVHRYSNTLQSQSFYYALRLNDGRILRASISTFTILSNLGPNLVIFFLLSVSLTIVAMLVAANLTHKILLPLNKLNLNQLNENDFYEEIRPLIKRIRLQKQEIAHQYEILSKQHNEYFTITNSMKEGLIVLNSDGNIIAINKSALKFYNTTNECRGQSLLSFDNAEHMRNFLKNKDNATHKSIEISKNGRDLKYYFNQIAQNDTIMGFAILIINITAQNMAQKQRQEFTANVSHELKTPLQSIIGYAELIENGLVKPEDLSNFSSRIKKQGVSLLRLIEDIIFLSSLDEGIDDGMSEHYPNEYFSLTSMICEIRDNLEMQLNEKDLSFELEGEDIYIYAGYRFFYELLFNLCDNAIKYNHDHMSVRVKLSQDDERIGIKICDQGIGIQKEDLERIFERFFRVDKSHSQVKIKGTGLGLSIVKRIVNLYHGKIKVKSNPIEGTSFILSFEKKYLMAREDNS